MIGKIGCHIMAWTSDAVIPFRHQQVPCTQDAHQMTVSKPQPKTLYMCLVHEFDRAA